ncbi:MAG: type VI secretion system-associated FHA domain protein TagH [Burkholderiales bacterium]
MSITVKITKRSADGRPTLYATRDLDVLPVSIGRDAGCTIALDDPQKHMSRFHVEIEEEGGTYWMSVVSKVNPVMVKGRRYGPGTRLTLKSGDSFELAEYEVQLLLPEAAPAAPARPVKPPPSDDPLLQVLATGTQPGTQPGPAPEDTAERLFNESTFFGGDQTPPAQKKPVAAENSPVEETLVRRRAPPPAPEETLVRKKAPPLPPENTAPEETFVLRKKAPPPAPPIMLIPREDAPPEETFVPRKAAPAPAPTPATAALRGFLDGAGLPHKELSAADSERLLRDGGAILRAAVEGLMLLLLARAEMRKEFEAEERTMVAARDNNPLKLMSDPHEAMDFLFDPAQRTDGFLDPVQAVGDACEDLRAHELALIAGMRAAIIGALRRFDPQVLERAFEKSAKGFSLASRKAQLWELFVAQQEKLVHDAQEDFNKVFGRDFMGAYQAQLRRLKGGR